MPLAFDSVFLTSTGSFLPGAPIDNDTLDRFIAPLDARSARIKRRILAENGIRTRHYAIDEHGLLHARRGVGARRRARQQRDNEQCTHQPLIGRGPIGAAGGAVGFQMFVFWYCPESISVKPTNNEAARIALTNTTELNRRS